MSAIPDVSRNRIPAQYLISSVTALVTAVIVGALIAGVAGAARAATVAHDQASSQAQQQAATSQQETTAELGAYNLRLQQSYSQLQQSYGELEQRDAAYRQQLKQADATIAVLQATNKDNTAKLATAYGQLQQAANEIRTTQQQYQNQLNVAYQKLQEISAQAAVAPPPVRRRDEGRGGDD